MCCVVIDEPVDHFHGVERKFGAQPAVGTIEGEAVLAWFCSATRLCVMRGALTDGVADLDIEISEVMGTGDVWTGTLLVAVPYLGLDLSFHF